MRKITLILVALVLICFCICTPFIYKILLSDNINDIPGQQTRTIYIPSGGNFESVLNSLKQQRVLKNTKTFIWFAKKINYDKCIYPGRYVLSNNSGNLLILGKLRTGKQDPIQITFNNIQNKKQLAKRIAGKLEATEQELIDAFNQPELLDSLHLTEENFTTIFLANTYEFYWNTSANQFVQRMLKEYNKFWTSRKRRKAEELNLSPTEVIILASIVQKESNHYDEYPRIAGVYINRLNKGIALQADPTVMFALNRLGIKRRVYKNDLKTPSPYNTYISPGLPPGPICLPELKSIEKILDAEQHNYIYFCAKEDFSGYHAFAETWQQHLQNARQYQRALNRHNIH